MGKPFKLSAFLMILCMAAPWNGALLAAGDEGTKCAASCAAASSGLSRALAHVTFPGVPLAPGSDEGLTPFASPETIFAQRGYGRGWGGNGGAKAAIILGAAAAIAGGAILVYANRPGCGSTPEPGGCSYGTKVIGGAMIAGGAVGITVGALSWR